MRDRAMRVLDASTRNGQIDGAGAEVVENLLHTGDATSKSWTARWAVETGSDEYRAAFAKLVADPDRGHMDFTEPEAAAFRAVRALQSEQRSLSTTDIDAVGAGLGALW